MWNRITSMIQNEIRNLFPAYFALVMATGIVSIACHLVALDFLAFPLFYLNQFFYIILWVLTLARIVRYPARLFGDMSNHRIGSGFLTIVAATSRSLGFGAGALASVDLRHLHRVYSEGGKTVFGRRY